MSRNVAGFKSSDAPKRLSSTYNILSSYLDAAEKLYGIAQVSYETVP
jgi:hypothetical protein